MDLGDDAYWDRKIQEREREEDEAVARYKADRDDAILRGEADLAAGRGRFLNEVLDEESK